MKRPWSVGVVLAFGVANSASAAEWLEVTSAGGDVVRIDTGSLEQVRNGAGSYWQAVVAVRERGADSQSTDTRHLVAVDCHAHRIAFLTDTHPINQPNEEKKSEPAFRSVSSNTVDAAIMEGLCF